jgi:predicted peptidase
MAQEARSFQASATARGSFQYLFFVPRQYDAHSSRLWPLILFLHGAGERGRDLALLKKLGIPKLAEADEDFPFVAVSPQCPPAATWHAYAQTLPALLDDVASRHRVDTDRVYLTGVSMGGYGAWSLGASHPERFAAIVPICGGGLRSQGFPKKVCRLRRVPVWAFHGAQDPIVPLAESQRLVDALQACGGNVRFTVYPDLGHDSWTRAYGDPSLFAWLLRQQRRTV